MRERVNYNLLKFQRDINRADTDNLNKASLDCTFKQKYSKYLYISTSHSVF
jgi:hypothetical protein